MHHIKDGLSIAAAAVEFQQQRSLRVRAVQGSMVAFRNQSLAAGFTALLPVFDAHVNETAQSPLVHHDPFERLLIDQVRVEGLMPASSDGQWPGYDVLLHRV